MIKRDLGHGLEIVERVHEEEGELCEHCLLEERKLEEARRVWEEGGVRANLKILGSLIEEKVG